MDRSKFAIGVILAASFLSIACYAESTSVPSPALAAGEYKVDDRLLIKTRDGTEISAIVVRPKHSNIPRPCILQFTIYVRDGVGEGDVASLKEAVDRGYVGVMAYTRGKRFSNDAIAPYEHDGADAHDVIDWISKQPWCDGRVGMYGGSYNGFTQWAAAKKLHPALKTIVPYVANCPGMGLPMENNIFINPNYEWTFLVTNNKRLDREVAQDRQRFRAMQDKWWSSGRAYRQLDRIDGTPNPLFQRWLSHPSYDEYWQSMVPYQDEFAQITIPVLSIDGYYNDSQGSGLYYVREHTKHIPGAEHYLVIGPYGHFGAQKGGEKRFRDIEVDAVAIFDAKKLTYEWFDYIFKNGTRPAILQDKINFQVMGTNRWRSSKSLNQMSDYTSKLFLSTVRLAKRRSYTLTSKQPTVDSHIEQVVDFADRDSWNNDYYPEPIVRDHVGADTGLVFMTKPLKEDTVYSGAFGGELAITINKRDVDLGVSLYELMPNGKYFQLSYIVIRASYSKDRTRRQLLSVNELERIPFKHARISCKQLSKGSRLVAYVDVNKNPFSQLNYGTGKDCSDETVQDAKETLRIKWHNQSFLNIPWLRQK